MKYFFFIIAAITISCSSNSIENLSNSIEYIKEKRNLITWSDSVRLSWDSYEGDGSIDPGNHQSYFGIYTRYLKGDSIRFEVYAYFHKLKSYSQPEEKWPSKHRRNLTLELDNLKFDFYEYGARIFRKFILENWRRYDEAEIRKKSSQHYQKVRNEWEEIINRLDVNDERALNDLQDQINSGLTEFSEYTSDLHSY